MSRRRAAEIRKVDLDAKHKHLLIAKFINCLMLDGKKSIAQRAFYEALDSASQKIGSEPIDAFEKIIENVRPSVQVKSRRVGGATYQVPMAVGDKRSVFLAILWLIKSARGRKDKRTIADKLCAEFEDAHGSKGGAVKKKEEAHKMAEANKAFAHYRW